VNYGVSVQGTHLADIQQVTEEDENSRLEKKRDKAAVLLIWIGMCYGIVTTVVSAIVRIVAGVEQENWRQNE
jgi:hypothetical protein